ncbi:MAG: DnaJ domain-containing protein, partial [Clostridia bacterium]|nr:DnaJ domain-containing protein [Clostridia bacterium]
MRNPYEVLGITSSANDDEVKRAYREMASKYADDAVKMDEINEAYDTIILSRNSSGRQSESYAHSVGNEDGLGDIRAKLNAGRIDDAEMLLDGIPLAKRSGEWYFLKGTIHQRRGWLESAAECFKRASEIDPYNNEYRAAYDNLKRSGTGQFREERTADNDGCCDSPCKICSGLMCADCCCEC